MSGKVHFIYISVFVAIITAVLVAQTLYGFSYYRTSLEDRFYHPEYNILKLHTGRIEMYWQAFRKSSLSLYYELSFENSYTYHRIYAQVIKRF